MKYQFRFAMAAGVMLALPAQAEVEQVRDGFFATKAVILVDAKPPQAWRALTQLPRWWDSKHTWSGSAKNLVLEPRAGGCFCEKLVAGGSVQHAHVIFVQPGQLLRLEGALGPLQEMPVSGVLTFALAPDGGGTRITMTYQVAGVMSMDAAALAPRVDQVMSGQFERLRKFINDRFLKTSR